MPGDVEQSNSDRGLRRLGRWYGMLVLRSLPLGRILLRYVWRVQPRLHRHGLLLAYTL